MEQKEFENLGNDELFEKIKTEYARKAKLGFVMGIVYGLLCLAAIIASEGESSELFLLSGILLVISFEKILFSLMDKNIMKAENAEELLSRYDAYTNKIGKSLPFIVVPALFLCGYVICHMITETDIERFGVVQFWLLIALFVLCFIFLLMMLFPLNGNAKTIGWKDEPIEHLRELVEKEKQDTL